MSNLFILLSRSLELLEILNFGLHVNYPEIAYRENMELTGGNMNNEVMLKICLAGSTAPDTPTLACGHLLGSCNSAYCSITYVHFHFLSGRSQKSVFETGGHRLRYE
ncbi:hypothetical protein ACFX13_022589 [Malus domestica]